MGKKKSVVLMTIITIVLLVLCAIVAFPKVTVPGSGGIKKWNPVVMQYDLGAEFGGGHYAYYYPSGVITETEYNDNVEALEGAEKEEYKNSYKQYTKDGVATSLYLSTDEDDGIWNADKTAVSEGFAKAFDDAVEIIVARFEERAVKTSSTFRVSVVDDYAVRVEISATEKTETIDSASSALTAMTQFAKFGEVAFYTSVTDSESGSTTSTIVEQLDPQKQEDGEEPDIFDVVKEISVGTRYEVAYLKIEFTSKGKEMLKTFTGDDSATALELKVGDETVLSITEEVITSKNEVEYGIDGEDNILKAHTLSVFLNSAMEEGGIYLNGNDSAPFTLKTPTASELRTFSPVYGDVLVWVYVALLVAFVVGCALAVWKMGGFGIANVYASVTYFFIVAFCFGFISGGVFAVNLSSVLLFTAGLAIVNVLHAYIYQAIRKEASLGKTIASSVKGGYKKTLWTIVDIYAVLVLGALGLLLGAAGLNTVACQALIVLLSGALCNLLWGRTLNVLLLAMSKDKYKYFRLAREEDEDDE